MGTSLLSKKKRRKTTKLARKLARPGTCAFLAIFVFMVAATEAQSQNNSHQLITPVLSLLLSGKASSPSNIVVLSNTLSFISGDGSSFSTYRANSTTPVGGAGSDFAQIEFYSNAQGTFDVASGINSNYQTCEQCVLFIVDDAGKVFYPVSGVMNVTGDPISDNPSISLTDIELVEVTIDPITFVSTPVVNGQSLTINSIIFY
jgi:hypothetical protein